MHVNLQDRSTVYADGHYSISLATENGARLIESGYTFGFGLIAYQSEEEAIQAATAWGLDLHVEVCDRGTVYTDGHFDISPASGNGARLVNSGYTFGFGLIAYQSEEEAIQAATAWRDRLRRRSF